MSDDEEDVPLGPSRSRPKKLPISSDSSPSSSSSGSPIINTLGRNSKRRYRVIESDETDSDSDYSIVLTNKRKKPVQIESDDSDLSPIITRRPKGCVLNLIETESEDDESVKSASKGGTSMWNSDSDSSNGETDCPICLLSFKKQELGTPESCDHTFCLTCIEQWSKNMNTCPVDRQEYTLILVRKKINGKIIRKIAVEKPVPLEEQLIQSEAQICCEICGSGDREDRLLLCDSCDLGFHLECLTPPLETIPIENWFCAACTEQRENDNSNASNSTESTVFWPMDGLLSGAEVTVNESSNRRRQSRGRSDHIIHARLIPRTRQNERLRAQIVNSRHNNPINYNESEQEPTSTTNTKRARKKTTKKRRKTRTVYEVDEETGQVTRIKKIKRKSKKKKSKVGRNSSSRNKRTVQKKTVKKRLALQLGICSARNSTPRVPDSRPSGAMNSGLNIQRHQAGIPVLHLFGQRNDLDYCGSEDDNDIDGGDYLVARQPTRSDVSVFRRAVRSKNVLISSSPVVSSSTDLLGSILESQSAFFSKNTEFSVDRAGTFKMEKNKKDSLPQDISNLAKETPYYGKGNRGGNYNRNYNNYQNNYYNQSRGNYNNYRGNQRSYNNPYWENQRYQNNSYNNQNNEDEQPQDYSRSTLSSLYDNPEEETKEEKEEKNNDDVDIYSDIEGENEPYKSPEREESQVEQSQPESSQNNVGYNSEGEDSEGPDMVIDTEKIIEESENKVVKESHEPEVKEECDISSTKDEEKPEQLSEDTKVLTCDQQSDVDQFSKDYKNEDEEDDDSNDGCPNLFRYSKQSITIAKNTEIPLGDEEIPTEESASNIKDNNLPFEQSMTDLYIRCVTIADEAVKEEASSSTADPFPESFVTSYPQNLAEPFSQPNDIYSQAITAPTEPSVTTAQIDTINIPPTTPLNDENESQKDERIYDPFDNSQSDESNDKIKTKIENVVMDIPIPPSPMDIPVPPSPEDMKSEDIKLKTEVKDELISTDQNNMMDKEEPNSSKEQIETSFKTVDIKAQEDTKTETKIKFKSFSIMPNLQANVEPIKSDEKCALYSDSEDEAVVKKNDPAFNISDMIEDIVSEEERSYTPCLDEKKQGFEGLDTEAISDDDKNDFEESFETTKASSETDALELNAKESEINSIRLEDYEEGEIVDKMQKEAMAKEKNKKKEMTKDLEQIKKSEDIAEKTIKGSENKENEKRESFKKISKSNKERNYRKDNEKSNKERSKSKEKAKEIDKRENKRSKRKELERYNVRAMIAEKPRRFKDQFGRDIRRSTSRSRSSSGHRTPPLQTLPSSVRRLSPAQSPIRKSRSPRRISSPRRSVSHSRRSRSPRHRSISQRRRSLSKERRRKKRRKHSFSRSPSSSPIRRRKRTPNRKKKVAKKGAKRKRSRSHSHSLSLSPYRRRDRDIDMYGCRWTPGAKSPILVRRVSPSWTPPHLIESAVVNPHRNLTVILPNDNASNKKKKDKNKKRDKNKGEKRKKRREDRTPPPSKEVFASGDNILVSVSFNKENERDVSTRKKKDSEEALKKKREKEKRALRRKKKNQELQGIKPVAIIDLDRSPFKELTPSPQDIIVLTDSENEDNRVPAIGGISEINCDSSEVRCPESPVTHRAISPYMNSSGPKTPPEPLGCQIKFSLLSKSAPMRSLINPLHEEEEELETVANTEAVDPRLRPESNRKDEIVSENVSHVQHIGPNTPPDPEPASPPASPPRSPANSPPSSPDAYDPFEPTKSRSPTPEPISTTQISSITSMHQESTSVENVSTTTDARVVQTLPVADIQPADSQSGLPMSPETCNKTPDQSVGLNVINQMLQTSNKNVQSTSQALATSTPVTSTLPQTRINILNTTVIGNSSNIPQRTVPPAVVKQSPAKISPTKQTAKTSPVKPMQKKTMKVGEVIDLDSPYSPGSSDYEDLFEPPALEKSKSTSNKLLPLTKANVMATCKPVQNIFDTLFGSPFNKTKKMQDKVSRNKKISPSKKGTKTVGVKIDEDHLKILEELPSSAVELQVKDKFLKKLNRQERVVEEVKLVLKPYYNKKKITKDEYKDIMRKAVPKICHNKSGEINPFKIQKLVEAYVRKVKHSKKVSSSSK